MYKERNIRISCTRNRYTLSALKVCIVSHREQKIEQNFVSLYTIFIFAQINRIIKKLVNHLLIHIIIHIIARFTMVIV